jgi:hypothetical protein
MAVPHERAYAKTMRSLVANYQPHPVIQSFVIVSRDEVQR